MRNKEQRGDLSVQAIAGTHVVVLLGMDLPEQKCFRYGAGRPEWWTGEQFADSAFWIHA
jgi:hypothetical protein